VRLERGSLEVTKEVRSACWESFVETFWQDLRFAARMVSKSPGFTTVAVLTLALGIGANTAIFIMTNGLMLHTLPVRDPGQLVELLLWLAKILLGFEIKSLRRFVSSRCDVTPERCSISRGSVSAPLPVCFALVAASY
jgi:hypothetical protein